MAPHAALCSKSGGSPRGRCGALCAWRGPPAMARPAALAPWVAAVRPCAPGKKPGLLSPPRCWSRGRGCGAARELRPLRRALGPHIALTMAAVSVAIMSSSLVG